MQQGAKSAAIPAKKDATRERLNNSGISLALETAARPALGRRDRVNFVQQLAVALGA